MAKNKKSSGTGKAHNWVNKSLGSGSSKGATPDGGKGEKSSGKKHPRSTYKDAKTGKYSDSAPKDGRTGTYKDTHPRSGHNPRHGKNTGNPDDDDLTSWIGPKRK